MITLQSTTVKVNDKYFITPLSPLPLHSQPYSSRPDELFNWLYTIESSEVNSAIFLIVPPDHRFSCFFQTETWDGGLLVWHVKYQHIQQSMLEQDIANNNNNVTKNSRLKHRLEIKKDDVQIVLPISKVSSNTK